MKGKLLKPIALNETTTVDAGTEVDVVKVCDCCVGQSYLCKMPDKSVREISGCDIIITDHRSPVDWNKIRIDASIKAMQSLIAKTSFNSAKENAELAVEYADAIIEELKK